MVEKEKAPQVLSDEDVEAIKQKQMKPAEKVGQVLSDEDVADVKKALMAPAKVQVPPEVVELKKRLGLPT